MKKVKTTFLAALILFITTLTMNVKAYTNTNNTTALDTNTTYYDNNAKVQLICVDPYMQGLAQGDSVTCSGLSSLTSTEQSVLKKIGCIIFNTDSTYTGKTDNQAIATAVHNKIAAQGSNYYYHWNPAQETEYIKSVVKIIGQDTTLPETCTTCGNVTVSATTPTISGTDFKSTITVTMPSGISATLSTTKGTLSQTTVSASGGTVTLIYPVSSVTESTTATITAKINCASPDTSKYEICDFNDAVRQRFFVYGRKAEERSNSTTITFTPEPVPEPKTITISKQDITNKEELPGAKLHVTCDDDFDEEWTSTETPKEFIVTPGAKCELQETVAPDGYEIELNKLEFEIDEDGKVVSLTDLKDDSKYKIEDTKITIYNGLKVPDTGRTISIIVMVAGLGLISAGVYILVRKLKDEPTK